MTYDILVRYLEHNNAEILQMYFPINIGYTGKGSIIQTYNDQFTIISIWNGTFKHVGNNVYLEHIKKLIDVGVCVGVATVHVIYIIDPISIVIHEYPTDFTSMKYITKMFNQDKFKENINTYNILEMT